MTAGQLRAILKRYGNGGVLFVAVYLALHHGWRHRRLPLLLSLALVIGLCGALLFLSGNDHHKAIVLSSRLNPKVEKPGSITPPPPLSLPSAPVSPSFLSDMPQKTDPLLLYSVCEEAAKGNDTLLRRMLHAGASAEEKGNEGPALVYAAGNGHLSTMKLLLHAGAKIETCDEDSVLFESTFNQALFHAAMGGHTNVIRFLLDRGANVNGQDDNGYTPLIVAADGKNSKAVRLLLAYGAEPNMQTRHWRFSALMLASQAGAKDSVNVLLRHGAEVDAEDKSGQTALWYAHHNRHYSIARRLRRAGARIMVDKDVD